MLIIIREQDLLCVTLTFLGLIPVLNTNIYSLSNKVTQPNKATMLKKKFFPSTLHLKGLVLLGKPKRGMC